MISAISPFDQSAIGSYRERAGLDQAGAFRGFAMRLVKAFWPMHDAREDRYRLNGNTFAAEPYRISPLL